MLDLADAHTEALELTAQMVPGQEICNLGSGSGFSVKQVLDAAGQDRWASPSRTAMARAAPVTRPCSWPPERARELLGWVPERGTLGEMIGSAWQLVDVINRSR